MSKYVDTFIRQHKEYFKRNKAVIESNDWNLSEKNIEKDIDQLFYEIGILQKEKETKETKKLLKEKQDEIFSVKNSAKRKKSALFTEENELTKSVLGRLSAFIKETEKSGDRKLDKVQSFVDSTVDIIKTHIDKCDEYLDYSLDVLTEATEDEDSIHFRAEEIKFQDDVFSKKISIQDTLSNLNITNSIDNVSIEFFKNEKASIPMIEVLPYLNEDIKELTDQLNIPKKIGDITFHIHRKKGEYPEWDRKKHYWEQTPETLKYWYNEWLKIKNGFWVDGFFFHPWLYYHLNFYQTPIPDPKGGEVIRQPDLRDNEWFISEQLKAVTSEDGYYTTEMLLVYGTRRFGKSVSCSSICEWRAMVVSNISTAITSGSEGDLSELTHKIKTAHKVCPPAFFIPMHKQEWSGGTVEMGLKKDQSTLLEHSRHTIKNMAGGGDKASQKSAGGAPSVYLIEEIAKFKFEKGLLAAKPSFETSYGYKTIVIGIGTSGESSLSGDALKAVSNPKVFKFREMDWDLFESKINPEFITWKRRTFATFIPGQMGYKTGFKRIKKGFGDFLGIKSNYLNKIEIQVTDWEHNTKVIQEERKLVENDPIKLQQETVQYPIDPEECFISKEKNIFPFKEARRKRQHLEKTGEWDRRRSLYRNFEGQIVSEISTEPLAQYPHNGDSIDSPFLIFEDIPQIKPPKYVYVAGGDFYKQETSDTDSVGTIYIWKYNLFADPFSRKLVASYSARPNTYKKFYDNCFLLMEAYNAVIFPENEDLGGFQTYLERRRVAEQYIMPHIDFNSALQYTENGKRKYGWTAKQSKQKLLNMFANYLNEPMMILNEQGEEIEVKTVETIDDMYLLEELEKFNPEGNFDRITACIGAVGYLHFLEKNYIYPKGYKGNIPQQQEKKTPPKKRKRDFYASRKNRSGFYRTKR
jgi:hypothetical protein